MAAGNLSRGRAFLGGSIDMRLILTALLTIAVAGPAAAFVSVDLKAHCKALTAFYDRYGAGRSETSDGARNHTRIGADIDCQDGRHAEGVAAMEDLLDRKEFDVHAAPSAPGARPSPR